MIRKWASKWGFDRFNANVGLLGPHKLSVKIFGFLKMNFGENFRENFGMNFEVSVPGFLGEF